jgi:conjugal transfer pilus assembly protein TraD
MANKHNRQIDTFWRPAYELYSAFFWLLSFLVCCYLTAILDHAFRLMMLAAIPAIFMFFIRGYQGLSHWYRRGRLFVEPQLKVTVEELIELINQDIDQAYMGEGFQWTQSHSQMSNDFKARDPETIKPPQIVLDVMNKVYRNHPSPVKGDVWLHGINISETHIYLPREERYSHRLIIGTTGAGKGRVIALDVIGAVVRGESLVILDPKLDENLLDLIWYTLKLMGQTHRLHYFSPAYPSCSVRVNLLKNYNTTAQLASRVIELLPQGGGDSESFKNFCWRAVNVIFEGLEMTTTIPTLVKLRTFIEGDIDHLLLRAGLAYFKLIPEFKTWADELEESKDDYKAKAQAIADLYDASCRDAYPNSTIESIISIHEHDRAYYAKLIQTIIPILNQLTSGPLRDLLSPEEDYRDPRPIVDTQKICSRGDILFMNLASLADPTTGSAIGSLASADLVNVIADRYFYQRDIKKIPMNIICDEASEVINTSSIRIANKSRGAECSFTIMVQSVKDIEQRLGSEPAMMQALGNFNIKSTLRLEDDVSQELMSTRFGETMIKTMSQSVATNTMVASDDMDFNTSYKKDVKDGTAAFMPKDLFGRLADLHYFTTLPGGALYKVRVPYITVPKEHRFETTPFTHDAYGELPVANEMNYNPKEFYRVSEETEAA